MTNKTIRFKKWIWFYIATYLVLLILEFLRISFAFNYHIEIIFKLFLSLSCMILAFVPGKSQSDIPFRDRFLFLVSFSFIFFGDVMLAGMFPILKKEFFFRMGLISFAFVHLFLIVRHSLRFRDFTTLKWSSSKTIKLGAAILVVGILSLSVRGFVASRISTDILIALTLYLAVLSLSFLMSIVVFLLEFYQRGFFLTLGVGLFYISDLLIGLSLGTNGIIYTTISWGIWAFYAPSLMLLAFSGSRLPDYSFFTKIKK